MVKKKRNKLFLYLKDRGIVHESLAIEVKRRFKRSKRWTHDVINDKIQLGIDEKIIFAICLGVSYKDFN